MGPSWLSVMVGRAVSELNARVKASKYFIGIFLF